MQLRNQEVFLVAILRGGNNFVLCTRSLVFCGSVLLGDRLDIDEQSNKYKVQSPNAQ